MTVNINSREYVKQLCHGTSQPHFSELHQGQALRNLLLTNNINKGKPLAMLRSTSIRDSEIVLNYPVAHLLPLVSLSMIYLFTQHAKTVGEKYKIIFLWFVQISSKLFIPPFSLFFVFVSLLSPQVKLFPTSVKGREELYNYILVKGNKYPSVWVSSYYDTIEINAKF